MGLPSGAGPGAVSERPSERGPWPGDLLGEHTPGDEFRGTARRRGLGRLARPGRPRKAGGPCASAKHNHVDS